LLVLIVALGGAIGYVYYLQTQMKTQIAAMQDTLTDEISKIHETSAVNTQTNRRSVDSLKKELEATRRQASQLAGEAKVEAEKHAEELAARLDKAQQEQTQRVNAVSQEVSQVKEVATTATSRIGEVSTEVSTVKSDVASTKSELEKTIANLKATQGDLGIQSGLIATNGKELAALKALGERNYVEFKLAKAKAPQRVGDIAILLKKADPKSNRYTIEVVADDKHVEKKDKTLNEPIQFLLSRAAQPYELVVNDIKKDLISGYVAAPKVQKGRNENN
jgi:chromosome segregation ATPase